MKLRRDVGSVPLRTGEETWQAITELLTGPDTLDREQLVSATSVMAMLITDEIHAEEPITVVGGSARVVLYGVFGGDALILGTEIDPLPTNPTASDWTIYVPCAEGDLNWASITLSERAPRIILHKPGELPIGADESSSSAKGELEIDWGALG